MKEELLLEIRAELGGFSSKIDGVIGKLDELSENTEEVDKNTKKAVKSMGLFGRTSPLMKMLNNLTGGLASDLVDVVQTLGRATVSAKAFSTALIATGIGALVVALGAIVAYWDEIVEYTTGWNRELNKSHKLLMENSENHKKSLDLIKGSSNILKLAGATQKQINNLQIASLDGYRLKKIAELENQALQLEGLKTYADWVRKTVGSVLDTWYYAFEKMAGFADTIFDTDLESRIKANKKSIVDWLESFVGVDEIQEQVDELKQSIVDVGDESAGLKLANIEIDKKALEDIKKARAKGQKILDDNEALLIKIDWELANEGPEIYDVTAINDIAVASGFANQAINEQKSFDVPGVEQTHQQIVSLEKAIKSFNTEFKDVLSPDQLASAVGMSIDELRTFGDEIRAQQDKFSDFSRKYKELFDPEQLKAMSGLSIEALDAFDERLEKTRNTAEFVANGVSDLVGDAFSAMASTIQTGSEFLDSVLGTIIGILEQLATAFLSSLIIEKIVGTGKKAVALGVAQANAITIATQGALALGPLGLPSLGPLIAGAMATVGTAFASISAFTTGGFSGDRNIVRVNGDEMILNPSQQATLFSMLRSTIPSTMGGATGGNTFDGNLKGEWKMKGTDMVLVVERAQRKTNRFG